MQAHAFTMTDDNSSFIAFFRRQCFSLLLKLAVHFSRLPSLSCWLFMARGGFPFLFVMFVYTLPALPVTRLQIPLHLPVTRSQIALHLPVTRLQIPLFSPTYFSCQNQLLCFLFLALFVAIWDCSCYDINYKKLATQAVKTTPHVNGGKGAILVPGTVKTPPPIEKEKSMGIKRVAGLT
jgi:hypothetical protein